ncbi:MAG TPA: hypothetical protein PLW35_01830 [Verrucomicrobiota bacterium]|nr:hypothetical protein [Verrucomicrobiota bacterium]HOK76442.1 hypothetical protein [Verrucomicrobiota bacterium]
MSADRLSAFDISTSHVSAIDISARHISALDISASNASASKSFCRNREEQMQKRRPKPALVRPPCLSGRFYLAQNRNPRYQSDPCWTRT